MLNFDGRKVISLILISLGFLLPTQRAEAFLNVLSEIRAGRETISETQAEVSTLTDELQSAASGVENGMETLTEIDKILNQAAEIESIARETGYDLQELEDDYSILKEGRDLRSKIHAIRSGVRVVKKLHGALITLETKAKVAQIQNANTSEELVLFLKEQNQQQKAKETAKKTSETLEQMRAAKARRNQAKELNDSVRAKGGKTIGNTGLLTFPSGGPPREQSSTSSSIDTLPITETVVDQALLISQRLQKPLISLCVAVFLFNIAFLQVGFKSSFNQGAVVSETIICLCLLSCYPELIRELEWICGFINHTFDFKIDKKDLDAVGSVKDFLLKDSPAAYTLSSLLTMPVQVSLKILKNTIFLSVDVIFNFSKAALVLFLPFSIFIRQFKGLPNGFLKIIFLYSLLGLWPLFWNGFGELIHLLFRTNHTEAKGFLADTLYGGMFSMLQLFSPFLLATTVMNSTPLGQAVDLALKATTAIGSIGGLKFPSASFPKLNSNSSGWQWQSGNRQPNQEGFSGRPRKTETTVRWVGMPNQVSGAGSFQQLRLENTGSSENSKKPKDKGPKGPQQLLPYWGPSNPSGP